MPISVEVYSSTDDLIRADSSTSPVRIIPISSNMYIQGNCSGPTANVAGVITTYTVPALSRFYLRKVSATGTNRAKFVVYINGNPVDVKYTWYTDFNAEFSVDPDPSSGIVVNEGATIDVEVTQYNTVDPGFFDATIYGRIEGS